MLYQLSYLGVPRKAQRASERAVYSEVRQACPPGFAFGYAGRGPAPLFPQMYAKSWVFGPEPPHPDCFAIRPLPAGER